MRILLLTDIPPCTNYTSGLVLNTWCDFLLNEGHEIYCALIKDASLEPEIPKDKKQRIKFLEIQKPQEFWGIYENVKFQKCRENLQSFFHHNLIALLKIPRIASEISEFSSNNDCEIILASIQGQTMTRLVRKISKRLKLNYVAQTWDPLEWWLKEYRFDPITKSINMREFRKVVQGSQVFMAMSWAMSLEFEKIYKVKCVTNIPGLSSGKVTRTLKRDKSVFNISFAGQLYAKEEFDSLVQALNQMKWEYMGKRIVLNLYGKGFDAKYANNEGIIINGYVPQQKLLGLLSSADLLYCPYWFSKEFEKPCRISFPAKLTSFLKTGRPVLMHAPAYASPRIFLEKNNAAYICGSLKIEDVIALIKKIMKDQNREKIGSKGYELFKKYMTHSSMKKSLLVSLGLMEDEKIREFELVRSLYIQK